MGLLQIKMRDNFGAFFATSCKNKIKEVEFEWFEKKGLSRKFFSLSYCNYLQ